MKRTITLIALLALSAASGAQQPGSLDRIQFTDFFTFWSTSLQSPVNGTVDEFRALASQSTLLDRDFQGFSSFPGYTSDLSQAFTGMVGFRLANHDRSAYHSNPVFRAGIGYYAQTLMTNQLYRKQTKPWDTIYSAQTGLLNYVDSVIIENYQMKYRAEQIRLDISVIFTTSPAERWSVYSGVGVIAGLSFNSYTEVYYDKHKTVEPHQANGTYIYTTSPPVSHDKTERFTNRNGYVYSLYIPLGIDFRIGKRIDFLRQIHLVYEARAGLHVNRIPELNTYTTADILQNIGIRLALN